MADNNKVDQFERVRGWLRSESVREGLGKALPPGSNPDAWIEGALAALRGDDELRKSDPMSTLGAIFEIASLGLRLEPTLGHAYLEARWDRSTRGLVTSAQVQYRGLIQLAYQNPEVLDVEANIVHKADEFRFCKGTKQELYHTWDVELSDRGPMRAVYSGIRYTSGYYSFQCFPIEDVLAARKTILQQKGVTIEVMPDKSERYLRADRDTGKLAVLEPERVARMPWIANLRPMVQKSAIRWSAKYWKLGHAFERAAQLAGLADAGEAQGLEARLAELLPESITRAIAAGQLATVEAPAGGQANAAMTQRAADQVASLGARLAATAPKKDDEGGA
jgi:phage RecT family recombinase